MFRWDLFIRDFRAHMSKQVKTLKEISNECNVNPTYLSGLRTGRIERVGIETLEKILKYMGLYYGFYLEKSQSE